MVRPAFVVAVLVALCAAAPRRAHAGEVPHFLGMYAAQTGAPLALVDSKIDARVRGPIVELVIAQTFQNGLDRATEATYIFPLPSDSAVSAMAMTYGARTIHAAIAPRADAQARYEQAIAAGLPAATLEQERPDVFTQTVAAIPAHGKVTVTLRVDTTARFHDGTWELALPLVVAPRFVPGSATGRPTTGVGRTPDTERAPDASRVTPGGAPGAGGATEVTLELDGEVREVASPTHELVAAAHGYTLRDPHSDHDMVVRWRSRVPAAGWVEQDVDGGYAAVLVEAPAAPAAARTAPLHVTVLLDRAATMRGDADVVAHPFVRELAAALAPTDSLAVRGSDDVAAARPADALRTLDARWPHPAGAFDLTRVLHDAPRTGAPALVLVSDGLVADDAAVLAAARALAVPVFVIGIGPAPNRALLERLAAITGGTVRFALPGDDVRALARDVLADAVAPPAPVTITWGTLAARELVPATAPRLGAGQAALVLARVAEVHTANARVRGDVLGFTIVTPQHAPEGATTPRGALARRWARLELDELIAKRDERALAEHALRYGLVSPATTMIAIGDEVVVDGGVKHTIAVPVSVPAGMRWQEVRAQIAPERMDHVDHKPAPTTVAAEKPAEKPRDVRAKQKAPQKTPAPGGGGAPTTTPTQGAPAGNVAPATAAAPAESEPDVTRKADEDSKREEPKPHRGAGHMPAHDTVATKANHGDDAAGGEDDEDNDGDDSRGARRALHPQAQAPAPAPTSAQLDEGTAAGAESVTEIAGFSVRRTLRLAAALGGGVVLDHGATGFGAVTARVDYGIVTRFGVEGALWLVGSNAEGNVLATVSRHLAHRLELGIAAGLHLGGGTGPAGALELRFHPRIRHLALYLRYDLALRYSSGNEDTEHATSAGVELRW